MTNADQFRVLVVDDDKSMRMSLVELLEAAGWQAEALSRAEQVADRLSVLMPDVILSDMRMPGMSGLELLKSLNSNLTPPLILISAHGDIPLAVQAIQDGAYSFVEKPYEPRRLLAILKNAAVQNRIKKSNSRLKERLSKLSGLDRVLLGETKEVANLRRDILDLADTAAPIFIEGETGTGKELVARALHDLSADPDTPFLALNCATLSADTFEADMFGALGAASGRLMAASGGTLFLDEIGACPPAVQAKLLRVIEDKTILPVGAQHPVPVSFRVISASNQDMSLAVQENRFRQDLLFRINTLILNIPPLRCRRDDLTLLAAHFLEDYARLYEVSPPSITQEDLAALLAHDWPGNVRELRNACERRVLSSRRGAGTFADAIRADQLLSDVPDTLREAVAAFERELIGKAIKANKGRMDETADALGIGRRTLNEKIVKLGLDKDALL